MNRQQKRSLGITEKEPRYVITKSALDDLKKQWTNDAVDKAFVLMIGLPILVIHDYYPKIIKKEGREERFADLILDLYDSVRRGFISYEDIKDCLKEECGIVIGGDKNSDKRIR